MRKLLIALHFASAALPAGAYIDYMPLMSVSAWDAISNVTVAGWNKAGPKQKVTASAALSAPTTVVGVRAGSSGAATKIAAAYPVAQRPEVERVFNELLVNYAKIEQHFGIPRYDVAGAVAMFIAGSYEAYRNTSIEPQHAKALVGQMRQIIGSNAAFAAASNAQKQEMYEQMAIMGMFMAGVQSELQRKPNPQIAANMRRAAKGYLEQFLKTDAERVQITASGLELR